MTRSMGLRKFIGSVAMMLLVFFIISITARAFGTTKSNCNARLYDALEQEYEEELRVVLAKYGYEKAGMMMTHVDTVVDGECYRTYTVTLHERHLSGNKSALAEVAGVNFSDANCQVNLVVNP